MIPSFINGLPSSVRRDLFQGKLLEDSERREIVFSFLRNVCNETQLSDGDVELVEVKDLSTGRARVPGHVVYRLDLLLEKRRTRTIFLKGFGKTEYATLTRNFKGWENRPKMFLYEEFAQTAANIAGVSKIRSQFQAEPHDLDFVGFTLAEKIPGVHSNLLFDVSEIAQVKPEFLPAMPIIVRRVAIWHAFADLMGKADRRFLQLTKDYSRSTNYLIDPDSLEIEGVDHEYLFSPESLVKFELENRHSEMAILAALPADEMAAALEVYVQTYVSTGNALKGRAYEAIRNLACAVFGSNSVEVSFLEAAHDKDPGQSLRALWNDMRDRTHEVTLAPFPALTTTGRAP
jgi:hypothetical protein